MLVNNPTLEIVILMDSLGSTWHVFQDVLLVCEFLISLFTMISVEQWISSIGCFCPRIVGCKCIKMKICVKYVEININCEKCTYNNLKVMCNLLVTPLINVLL